MPSFSEISVSQLARLMGTPDAPTLIDLRIDEDFALDPRMIPAAIRLSHKNIADIARAAGPSAVIICQGGLKLSHGVAAQLRAQGIAAEALEGGFEAWGAAELPLVSANAIPALQSGSTLWVTRHRPKIDRIACPWLIRRFVDPGARFLFVPPRDVLGVADRFGATPFDVEGVAFSHKGDLCTFERMLQTFALNTAPLFEMAKVIRGADTNRHDLAPQAAGLLALSVGLSRMYRDDMEQLDAGMLIYDALYRWARDGLNEGHDWPNGAPA
ncbi:MAG: chromate resistance protein ChrB domain-containing protein [Paracoccaceae bacterium]